MSQPEIVDTNHTSYGLFRQAIVNQDADAWAAIYTNYRPLMIHWGNQCRASIWIDEPIIDLIDQAFARAWAALRPAGFDKFPNLAALLGYLRRCVTNAVADCARAQAAQTRMRGRLDDIDVATPEQLVIHESTCNELWRLASSGVVTEQERTVLYEYFVLDLPPRMILLRHPELFANITAVYSAKRNLLDRLQRRPELSQLSGEG